MKKQSNTANAICKNLIQPLNVHQISRQKWPKTDKKIKCKLKM